MKNIVRGGALAVMFSLLVAFVYAQTTQTDQPLIIANESQAKLELEENIIDIAFLDNNLITSDIVAEADDEKLVKKTASVKASGMGASRGSFSATAYCLRGRTAMGHGVRRGLIAADPRVLRLGSRINIAAGPYSGSYLVSDTGGKIKGKRLDIWMPSCTEAKRFGRRSVQVFQ